MSHSSRPAGVPTEPVWVTGSVYVINPSGGGAGTNVTVQSGSITGLLVGGVPVANSNPVPVTGTVGITSGITVQSGSVIGQLVGGQPVSKANAVPGFPIDNCGQVISGSTIQTVQYAAGTFILSGTANQVIAPQGAGSKIRLLSCHVMAAGAVLVRFASTGSAGSITMLSGLNPIAANGGFVLPQNQHGWLETAANEGLNLDLSSAVSTGITLTWVKTGP